VTTTVIGNCGFAIAPCRPADRDLIMRTLVKVEGMSLAAMRAGVDVRAVPGCGGHHRAKVCCECPHP